MNIKIKGSNIDAIIPDDIYNSIKDYKYYKSKNGTISRRLWVKGNPGKTVCIPLANDVMNNHNQMYDHKDRNPFNNTRDNLRPCDYWQNNVNRAKSEGCSSKYKGVYYRFDRKCWNATIRLYGRKKSLGVFHHEINAAKAYNEAALKHFGEFAVLNVI